MKKLGLFGGCFNPPNNIHIQIAKDLIENNKLDEVIFVPVNDLYNKDGLINANHRYNMLKIAIKGYKNVSIEDVELKINKKFSAIDIFSILKDKYSNFDLYMIMGSDNYEKMSEWKNYNMLKNDYKYIVIPRNKNDISSSEIRDMIKNNNNVVIKYISKDVYQYIIENKLYKDG